VYADRHSRGRADAGHCLCGARAEDLGAINFTASHNPPEYNGIKFSTHDGAPALPEVTKKIEAAIAKLQKSGAAIAQANPPKAALRRPT
jgi:phosphomannomutase